MLILFLQLAPCDPTYKLDGDTLIVSGTGSISPSWKIEIPSSSVKNVKIEEGITEVLTKSFNSCTNLQKIIFPNSLTTIQKDSMQHTSIRNIFLPQNVKTIETDYLFFHSNLIESIEVDVNNKYFSSENGCLYNKEKTRLILSPTGVTTVIISSLTKTIGTWCFQAGALEYVNIPDSVTSIEKMAFVDTTTIKYINFSTNSLATTFSSLSFHGVALEIFICPPLVTMLEYQTFYKTTLTYFKCHTGSLLNTISSEAFRDCSLLETIEFPKSVTSISNTAFTGCSSLSNIIIDSSSQHFKYEEDCLFNINFSQLVFVRKGAKKLVIKSNTEYIPQSNLQTIDTFESVEFDRRNPFFNESDCVIYKAGFGECSYSIGSIKSIEIAAETSIVGKYCFAGNTNLESVKFKQTSRLIIIDDGAFYGCSSLREIILPEGLQDILSSSFEGTGPLKISFPNTLKTIQVRAFFNSGILEAHFNAGSNLESLGAHSFQQSNLTFINLPTLKLSKIDKNVFIKTNITEIVIPDTIGQMGEDIFQECENLKTVTFSNGIGISSIPPNTFYRCKNLETVNFADQITTIGAGCFTNCFKLKNLIFSTSSELSTIQESAFMNCESLASFHITSKITSIMPSAFMGCINLTKFTSDDTGTYKTNNNIIFRRISNSLCIFTPGLDHGEIPKETQNIEERGLYGCRILSSLIFNPESNVRSIGKGTFYGCLSLTSLQLPGTIQTIDDGAFESCSSLENITVADGSQLKSIGASTFSGCTMLSVFKFLGSSVLESIGRSTFAGSRITKFDFPSTINCIGNGAFDGCESLSEINFISSTKGLLVLPSNCFRGTKIESVLLPESITEIQSSCFFGCLKLSYVQMPPSVAKIGQEAFCRCSELASFQFPSGLEEIGKNALSDCKKLSKIFYCGNRKFEDKSVVENTALNEAFTLTNYTHTELCGVKCQRVMMRCMVLPSSRFTAEHSDRSLAPMFAFQVLEGNALE